MVEKKGHKGANFMIQSFNYK